VLVRLATAADRAWIAEVLRTRWGATSVVVRGTQFDGLALPALIAEDEGRHCGLATLDQRGAEWEIVTLDALEQRCGVGTSLLEETTRTARAAGAKRLLVVTTNDNLDALRFYQRRGFAISAIRPDAIRQSRKLKPSIPQIGQFGIPIRDEIELVRML
jgi:N-acetylglutamate synthase-like GNAT family acetyltransferase